MESVACNLCGGTDLQHLYSKPDEHFFPAESFDVVKCRHCGLAFVNPRPSVQEVGKYYPSAFFGYFDADREREAKRYANEARYLARLQGGDRLLLDVGCANGDFPRYMRGLGWRVEGVEVAAAAKEIADFPVHRGTLSDLPYSEPRYDAITAWAVLEHVHDPMGYFRKAAQVLKPQGLFIFNVPNFASVTSRHLFGEDIPRHLYFFSPTTIRAYLDRAGLELVSCDIDAAIYEMRPKGWVYYLLWRLLGKDLRFVDLPEYRHQYFARKGLKPTLAANLRYVATHPLAMLDRLLLPAYECWQLARGTYGMATYVARRRSS